MFKQIYQQLRLQFGGRCNSQRLNINAFNNFDWCPMAGGTNEPLYCQQWCNVCLYDQHASKWPSNLVNTSDKSQKKIQDKEYFSVFSNGAIIGACDICDKDYNIDNWEPWLMTIFVTWQLIVTLDSIRNSCDSREIKNWVLELKMVWHLQNSIQ